MSRRISHAQLAVLFIAVVWLSPSTAKLQPGAGCGNAKDHCDAPKSNLGCCFGNTKCYSNEDCASYLKTCAFTNDTKKGESIADCVGKDPPKAADFKQSACAPEVKVKLTSTDGKEIPLNANASCYQTPKLTCQLYRNATGHAFVSVACKDKPKKASAAQPVSSPMWQGCLLLGLLVASLMVVLGRPF